jgi:hypothetical protein
MAEDDFDDEDWYDEDDEPDDEESATCPECGGAIYSVTDKCPRCGSWLSDADQRVMWSGMSKPLWLRVTAVILLIAFLASLLAIGAAIF